MTSRVSISDIDCSGCSRQDFGNIPALAESIERQAAFYALEAPEAMRSQKRGAR